MVYYLTKGDTINLLAYNLMIKKYENFSMFVMWPAVIPIGGCLTMIGKGHGGDII